MSTAYRSACVFLQADCPQIHRVILSLKFNAKFGQIRYKKAHPANPHSIRVDFSGSLLGKPYIIATAHHKNQNKRLYRPILEVYFGLHSFFYDTGKLKNDSKNGLEILSKSIHRGYDCANQRSAGKAVSLGER